MLKMSDLLNEAKINIRFIRREVHGRKNLLFLSYTQERTLNTDLFLIDDERSSVHSST
jgi:hypothetical protein